MSVVSVWNPATYDQARRRLVPCFDAFYGAAAELTARSLRAARPQVLDLGAGTGLLSAMILRRVPAARLTLQDGSEEMLDRARARLAGAAPQVVRADFETGLAAGEFDAIVSALAIHHLEDAAKRALFRRIHAALTPGGVFVNAEQIQGADAAEQRLFEAMHLDTARALGSDEREIAEMLVRLQADRCATLADQVMWLREAGFARSGNYYHWFRFAVYAGWKAPVPDFTAGG